LTATEERTGLAELAALLEEAERTRRPIAPPVELDPDLTLDGAYSIQSRNIERRVAAGARRVGHKVGLTSKAMQAQLGVDEPDFGVLLDGMMVEEGQPVRLDKLIAPRVEAEIAFLLAEDLIGPGVTTTDVVKATAGILPVFEVIDSRVADWKITLLDTVADNASSARVVLGGRMTSIDGRDPRLIGGVVTRNGELVATGAGAAVLGNPLTCVAWLANALAPYDGGLKAGDLVLAGAVHAAFPVAAGDVVRAEFAGLGSVVATFADGTEGS
jgi:2-oxopent-4-enoate hydratase